MNNPTHVVCREACSSCCGDGHGSGTLLANCEACDGSGVQNLDMPIADFMILMGVQPWGCRKPDPLSPRDRMLSAAHRCYHLECRVKVPGINPRGSPMEIDPSTLPPESPNAPSRLSEVCTGTLVHSEYLYCPVHDSKK